MFYVVAMLKPSGNSELAVVDEVKVSKDMVQAVRRLGAWKGSLFGVWEVDERPNEQDAQDVANGRAPESIWVFVEPDLFRLDDEYLQSVKGSMFG